MSAYIIENMANPSHNLSFSLEESTSTSTVRHAAQRCCHFFSIVCGEYSDTTGAIRVNRLAGGNSMGVIYKRSAGADQVDGTPDS